MSNSLRSVHAVESREVASLPARVITNVVILLAGALSMAAFIPLLAS